MAKVDYKAAGVDISAGNEAVTRIKSLVESTFSPQVLTPIGSFGAMYDLSAIVKHYRNPVLVQSIDGVGTKMMVAKMCQNYATIGMDLVSATANDIIVLGAKPLTLLDYIANDKLNPTVVATIVAGMVKACRDNGIALVGGETAEMPGTYLSGEHDLVGVITGVVEKDQAILGAEISAGDVVLGFASSGLHTNGYSLARKLLFETAAYSVTTELPSLSGNLGEVLLQPHINYTQPILKLLAEDLPIKGMAHITGGGLVENLPRILPEGCQARLNQNAWPVPPIFNVLQTIGQLDAHDMYRTFNMGIGLVLVTKPEAVAHIGKILNEFPETEIYQIGEIVSGIKSVRII